MSHSPTYVGRLDPQFRRFVNVLSVHPTSPTSSLQSLIDNKDEAATSSASSSCSGEKFAEFLTVNAYTDESWPGTQSQREVSEFFLEYVNVLSSGSESSLMTDDKEIATSTATSKRQKNSQNGSNSGQHSSQERIPDDSIVDDSAFESDVCRESFSDENYCLQKQPGVSNKRHHFNRPASGSFSSEADSERNYTNRNEAVVCLQDSSDMERLPGAGAYSVRKENISSVPRLRGQNVSSRSLQDTSRHMDDSIDDFSSVDSELYYSPDIIEDDCSSISSADSSFVCFALVGEQEEAKPKRKIASNVGRGHRHKFHKSRDSSRSGESDGKERDHGVMACVVTGISGGPAVRVYREDGLKKSAERQGSEIEYVRKVKEASSDGKNDMKANTADKDVSKELHFPRVRSKGRSLGFVFGVFGTPENPALEEEISTRVDVSPLNAESGASTCGMEDVDAYRNRLPMFPGIDLQDKPSVDGKRIYQRSNDLSAIEYDIPTDNMVAKTTEKALSLRSSGEERIDDISLGKPPVSPEESPGFCTREPKPLPSQGRLKKKAEVNEGDKGLRSSKSVIDAEDKEQAVPLEKHSSGFTELKRDVRVKAVSKSVQDRRPRRKRKEDEQHRMEHEKAKPGDEKKLSGQTDPADSQRKHDSKDVKDRFAPNRDVKTSEFSSPLYFTNRLGIDSHKDKQDSKATGCPKSRTGNLRDETFLMTGEVQENISDEYTAAEFKTDLLTPVKQTIRESIQAGFLDHGTSSEELKTSLNEDDQVCPESWSGGALGTQLEVHKRQQPHTDQSLAMEIAEGVHSMSGDILIKDGFPSFDLAIDHSEINSKEDNFVFTFQNRSENNLERRAMEHGYSGTMDSMETTKTVEQFTPDVSPKSDVLINNGTKNISSFPEFDGSRAGARTAVQEAAKSQGLPAPETCGHDDSSFSNMSPRRFTDENLEISSNGYDSSSSTLSCSKTSSHYDIDDVVGESLASKMPKVHQTNPTDKNEIVGGDDSKWIHLPSKEEEHFLSFPSVEKVEKENLELKKRYRTTGTKIDPPISEEVEMAQDSLGGSAAGFYETLDVSEEDSNKAKSLDGHSESLDSKETIHISTKQASTITIFPDAQRPQEVSEILVVRPRKDSKNTTGKFDKSLHPFAAWIEPLPVLARGQDKNSIGLIPAPGGNEPSKEKLSVNEDVCFVALNASEHSKDGACITEDKADLFTTKPASVSNQVTDEGNAIPEESDLDLREGVFRKRNVAGHVLILDEGEKRPHNVEEVVCSYQEPEECLSQNECNPVKQISGVRNADTENSTKMESDVKTDVWLSTSLPDVTTQTEVVKMSKPRGGMRELYVHVSETDMGETFTRACLEETVFELSNRDGFPLGSKIVKNDVPDWMPCNQFTHCGCLQRYLHQHSHEKEIDGNQKSDTFSVSLKKLDTHPSLQGAKANECHANPSVQQVFDKQCQVKQLEEYTQPEYKTKEIQASLPYSVMNKECQTNESAVIVTQPEVLQQQSIECQTELPPIFYASCGVQVECENIERNNQRQRDKKGLYTDQHCQTFPDYELILTSSKKSQTLVFTEDFSRSPVDHRNATLHESKSSHEISFDNKECQTSEHYIFTNPNSNRNSNEAGSSDFLCLANKECQTSRDIPLATSSTQCNILPFRTVEEVLASKKIKALRPPSCENKECQTLLDDYMILATSKHCQTSWPHSLEENPVDCTNAGDETGTLFDSKECQTLPDRNLPQLLSKECQTLDEFASDLPGTLKGFQAHPIVACSSKESQTTEVPIDDTRHSSLEVFETIKVEFSVQSTQTEDTPLVYENRESQTTPDQDLLLSSSKICQTTELEPVTAYEERQSQTLHDGEMFLITSKESDSKECQTLPDSNLPLLLSKECQTLDEFASDLPGTLKGFHAHPIVACSSKESQTTEVPMDDTRHSSLEVFETIKVEFSVQSTQTEDTPLAYENRESQTTPDQELLLSFSKICQTTELEPVTAYENRESQTLPDGEMFLITSKESQTMPYHLYGLPSELPNDRYEDMCLSNIANAEVYSETSTSAQMSSRRRPDTYGKSPETTEKCFFEFQTELIQTNVELDPTPAVSSLTIDVSEKGCQTVLCNCGSCADENNFASLSSDAQKGAAMRVSEGMQKEQASLIKQLDMLRDMNQKLRDDKDAIEAAHEAMLMAKKERGHSLSDEIEEAEKKTKVSRQGSQMSKYVKKRRAPPAEETWGNQGPVESFSGEEVDNPNNTSDGTQSRRRISKRRDMKKQGSVMYSYLSNSSQGSVTLHDSIQEEAEFDGDPTLEIISDEKLKELEQPAWAKKIMSCVQPKEIAKKDEVEEEEEEDQIGTSDEELEEDVFRKRKAELTSRAARGRLKVGDNESDVSYSEGLSGETGSETDDRPNSPRAAPVGKDNEMCRTVSQDMSEAGVSTISEPATPERVFKVVFVGDSGVGKSSFIHRFCHDAWKPSFTATIGVDFQIKTLCIDSRCIALQLWDTAGQERFRSITKQYFRKADGVIVFYDITMETSFLNIKNWMISVEEGTDDGTAIMIVGNKTDLVEDDSERAVKSQDGKKLAEEYKALYTETSAKTGFNIQESMAEFSKMLQVREDELMQSVLNLVQEPQPKKKCCK